MELDYFTLNLRNYLRDHGFSNEDLEADIVNINADTAARTYADERKAGNSVSGATELAQVNLFMGIGLSRIETAADILEEHFYDRIQIYEPLVVDLWSHKLAEDDSIWESFSKEGELGLNEELVEEGKKGILLNRIDQFLTNHGVQQKTEATRQCHGDPNRAGKFRHSRLESR